MSLRKQWCISLVLAITVLMLISTAISISNARQQLLAEDSEHAQDTATLLANALSQTTDNTAQSKLLIAAFEQSHFDAVIYRDTQNKTLFERYKPVRIAASPQWFINALSLTVPTASADVVSNTAPLGNVQVTADLDSVYTELWQLFYRQIALLLSACVVLGVLGNIAIHFLLLPLKRIQEQAAAICQRQFVEQQPLPKIPELRDVADAINRMSRRLKIIFYEQLAQADSLRAQSFLDAVTGLSNRRSFNARLQAITESETDSNGCLMLIQISDFARYNLQHGHAAGDDCLRAAAAQLQAVTKDIPDALVSRRAGADFACYLPNVDAEKVGIIADKLIAAISHLSVLFQHQLHIGIVHCSSLHAERQLLPKADTALRQAQSQSRSGWHLFNNNSDSNTTQDAGQWFATLNRVLQDRKIFFHFQPMFSSHEQTLLAVEAYSRINVREGIIHAGVFMPMAERFDLSETFDRLVIDSVRNSSEAANCKVPVCINLSPRSVISAGFLEWLDSYLREHPVFAQQMIIETSEYLMCSGDSHVRHLCDVLHRHGAKLSLDHFGIHSSAFAYLNSLPLDFIKIDRSFIRDIHVDADNQFYVRSLIQIAHNCDISILAEGVENIQEWECLCQLGINGGQGYLLGKPDSKIKQTML